MKIRIPAWSELAMELRIAIFCLSYLVVFIMGTYAANPVESDGVETHEHNWELVKETTVFHMDHPDSHPLGSKWTYRCKECLEIKVTKNF